MPMSTASRFLSSLQAAGAVVRDENGAYRIGPTIHDLAGDRAVGYDLLALGSTHIAALAKTTGETAGIAAATGDDVLHLGQVSSAAEVTVRDWTGEQVAVHAGCTGLVVMASWPEHRVETYLAGELERFSPFTVTAPQTIRDRLETIRRQGFLWTTDEYALDITSVAAPVFDRTGTAVAALHTWGPSYRFPRPGTEDDLGVELTDRASSLSAVLGHEAVRSA